MASARVIAHRGASAHRPENSLAAFREAIRLGADGIELDLHVSASGHLVIHHDAEIPGLGLIARLGLPTIRQVTLASGEPIPTLEDAIDVIGQAIQSAGVPRPRELWIELKDLPEPADPTLLRAIERAPNQLRCAVHSFDHSIIGRLGRRHPWLRRGILFGSRAADPVGALRAVGATVLWQDWHSIDAGLVAAVHAAGCEIIAWTVNDSSIAGRLAKLGVDGLCGNWPERLRVS